MLGLFRTSPPTKENRRHGLTQFLVDMKTPGITVNPIYQMTGQHDFNEVVFEDAFMPDDHVLGEIDGAWKQATSELAYERSGPERFLETFYVLIELIRALGPEPDLRSAEGLGRLVAQLHTLRRMSVSVAGMLQAGKEPVVEGSIVKDLGTIWEQKLPDRVRELAAFLEPEIEQPRDAGGAARLRHHDRAQAHDPGRHHRNPARHHRARAWACAERSAVPDIGKMLWPKSVAVVGASSDTHGLRGRILEIMLQPSLTPARSIR